MNHKITFLIGFFFLLAFPLFSYSQELECLQDSDCASAECCRANTCVDGDRDGDGSINLTCGGNDCDDDDPERYPGNAEVCDAGYHDEDCNPDTIGFRDADGDGFNDDSCCNEIPGSSELNCGDDCDDFRRTTNPNSPEVCNGIDDDCSGVVDDWNVTVDGYPDMDMDGHGNPDGPIDPVCPGTLGYSVLGNDCDDNNPAIKPGAMMCSLTDPSIVSVCLDDGTWEDLQCSDECVSQYNGTGFCRNQKVNGGKKK